MPAQAHDSPLTDTHDSPPSGADDSTTSGLRALAVVLFVVAAITFVTGFVLAAKGDSWADGTLAWSPASFLTLLGVLALMKARGLRR